MQAIRNDVRSGAITSARSVEKISSLMTMAVLRNMAPIWLDGACAKLLRVPEGGSMNVIEKGWYQIYVKDATDPAFLEEAIAEDAARKAEKAEIEAARVVERTAAAVEEALANGNVDPASVAQAVLAAAAAAAASSSGAAECGGLGSSVDGGSLPPLNQLVIDVSNIERIVHEKEVCKPSN